MRYIFATLLAFLATATASFAAANGVTTIWFSEDANTFKVNVGGKWRYESGVAKVSKGKIAVADVSDDESIIDPSLRYRPDAPSATDIYAVGEMTLSFDELGDLALKSNGGYAGIQIVDGGQEDALFAVLDPVHGDSAWLVVSNVPARLCKDYVVRYEVGRIAGFEGRCVRYLVRDSSGGEFTELAKVGLSAAYDELGEIAYTGCGTVTKLDFGFNGGDQKSLTMDVGEVNVRYGVDFTNASVSIVIDNYWKGDEFKGGAFAEYCVYDSQGRRIATSGAGGISISSNGVYEIGFVGLPNGAGNEYRFEVNIFTTDERTGEDTTVEMVEASESAVRKQSGWFHENSVTFSQGGVYGTWTYGEGTAYTNDDMIVINTGNFGSRVDFLPDRDVTSGVVTVENDVIFEGASAFDCICEPADIGGRVAAVTVVSDSEDGSGHLHYAAWVPDDSAEGGRFVIMQSSAEPTLGSKCRVSWTFNHHKGELSYSVDGASLFDENGISGFKIPSGVDFAGRAVKYFGQGKIKALDGDTYSANLAAYVDNGVTNEYATVDEAVAEAMKGNGKVVLLWDATWRPLISDVGRTVKFEGDGKQVYVDGGAYNEFVRRGYDVIDNGDGSYTIGVIYHYLTFDINGGNSGAMDPQPYSVTNMVFAIMSNRFEREGFDFARWNQQKDGKGVTNWTDGAVIDMTPYGLTNMTLYAQWRIAIRTVLIEAADEFVYIEKVTTNGVENTGVRYFCEDPEKATGHAIVYVENGSSFTVQYSTDIEKTLTFNRLKKSLEEDEIYANDVILYAAQPQIFIEGYNEILSPIQYWAVSKNINLLELAQSKFAQSSYALDTDKLLTESSRVEIYDVKMLENGISFKLNVDGKQISDAKKVSGMVKTSDRIDASASEWKTLPDDKLSVNADGSIVAITDEGADDSATFVKIVIPSND